MLRMKNLMLGQSGLCLRKTDGPEIYRHIDVICSTPKTRVPSIAGLATDRMYLQSKAD